MNNKMNGMKKYLFAFALLSCISLKGQDTITYRFIDEYRLEYKGEQNELVFNAPEFSYNRIFIRDSIFKEIPGLLYDYRPYEFKIQNGCWYIKKTGKWQLFYSPNKIVTPKLKIYFGNGRSWWFNFKPVGTQTLYGYLCIIYKMEPIEIRNSSTKNGVETITTRCVGLAHTKTYWFNPVLGIIKIETANGNSIREDIIQ